MKLSEQIERFKKYGFSHADTFIECEQMLDRQSAMIQVMREALVNMGCCCVGECTHGKVKEALRKVRELENGPDEVQE